jgi:glycine/D-amino acid oxidase-like deaminating enzyme
VAGLPEPYASHRRPPLAGDADADVCVVGAGFTGLWTAYHLLRADPSLRVLVVEAGRVGFGASGRGGGWCSALFPVSTSGLVRRHGLHQARAMRCAMARTVDAVGRDAQDEGVDCHYRKGGTVVVARDAAQLGRARAEVAEVRALGLDELDLLDAGQARERLDARGTVGGTWTPDCARLHPGRLVHGLAGAVERRGGRIAEGTRALRLLPGRVETDAGTVRCEVTVRATEAYTALLPGLRRAVVPVYSLVLATEPLDEATWSRIGLARAETFSEHRHLVVYGQRTADDRLVFGGRGAPYHFGSRVSPRFDHEQSVFDGLRRTLLDLFPVLRPEVPVAHAWGGPLGIPRDWHAGVGYDRPAGLAWAGGYVGDGVGTSHLAGRTLADLVTGADTDLVRLPWVGHRSPAWEPEPLRWLGVNAGLRLATAADVEERLTGRPSRLAGVLHRLTGG